MSHESAIRTPKQLVAAVVGFFAVTIIGIVLLVQFVTAGKTDWRGVRKAKVRKLLLLV